jgi:hypothetical protein
VVDVLLAATVDPALVEPDAAAPPELAALPALGAVDDPEVEEAAFDPGDEVPWPPGPIVPVPQAAAAPAPSATSNAPSRRCRRGLMSGSP